jgi:hypothetical protein
VHIVWSLPNIEAVRQSFVRSARHSARTQCCSRNIQLQREENFRQGSKFPSKQNYGGARVNSSNVRFNTPLQYSAFTSATIFHKLFVHNALAVKKHNQYGLNSRFL